jgi:penicillin-binding protein 2
MNKLPIIEKGTPGGMDFDRRTRDRSTFYLFGYFLFIAIFFCILVSRLFQLTVVKGVYYRSLSEDNRIREIIIEPERGKIIDRKGFVLVDNQPADVNGSGNRLISPRYYHDGETYGHVVGYRQLADETDVKDDDCFTKITSGDKVGKKGIEKIYECALRGRHGSKLVEVDAHGTYVRTINVIPPENGSTIQLALDETLQKKAYEVIKEKQAVIVGLKPKTGEVLVMASSPSFNPQAFEDNISSEIKSYFTDKNKPMFNRALEGTYPPGSTFKIVMAAGALEDKTIDDKTVYEDTGTLIAGAQSFGNWYYLEYGKKEGEVNVVKALQRSNDIFFYQIGGKMGPVAVKSWAEKFGYGNKTGTGLDESAGTLPSPFWKEDVLKEQWYTGDTYNMAIGQGYILATPMQVALSTSVIANDGEICKPKLIKNSSDVSSECQKLSISKTTLDILKEGMVKACAPGGTGWPLFHFGVKNDKNQLTEITTACKTGTAESHGGNEKPYAWFTVYAPAKDPEIILTAMVENAGQGSDEAGPLARDILKIFFERKE